MNKLLIKAFFLSLLFSFSLSISYASDFVVPNSSGEPVVIDISNLNLTSGISVSIGEFTDQPRTYRSEDTKSLVIFPPSLSSSEKTIQIQSGGSQVTKTISFRGAPQGTLKDSLLPSLKTSRGGNTLTKLSDGRVVLIGGSKSLALDPIGSIEIFNPEEGISEYLKTPNGLKNLNLKIPRGGHSATYLGISEKPLGMIAGPVEQILVAGGFSNDGVLESSLEIVEIKVGTLEGVSTLLSGNKSKLKKARIYHTASLLPNGQVLIVGGQGRISKTNLGALSTIEIFDPAAKAVQNAGFSLSTPRLLHTATTLQNGTLLIAGGFTNEKQNDFGFGPATDTAEIIDLAKLTIKNISVLKEAVGGHTAELLTNGLVILIGGSSDLFSSRSGDTFHGQTKSTVQFFDPVGETFNLVTDKTSGGNLTLEKGRFLHRSVLLPNGDLVVIGGLNIQGGSTSGSIINTPVSLIEVFTPDLVSFSTSSLKAEKKQTIETNLGRILPVSVLITPKNKTQGLLSKEDADKFVNCAVYVSGGFTNGFGKLPTKISEILQIESNNGIEGRQVKLTPGALIQGSYINKFLVELDKFTELPRLTVTPQTINLSVSNNFMANIKVQTVDGENQQILLKSESTDPNGSIVVSPLLFQSDESVSITRKDGSVAGEFEITFLPQDTSKSFVPAKVKVNVSDSSKPFLSTNPPYGISLSTQDGNNSEKIQTKVLNSDGSSELTSIPPSTPITLTISNPEIANLGGTGISSVTGTLATQFTVNSIKPGKTNLNFSINFPDVLGVSIPLEVSGTPSFATVPVDSGALSSFVENGLEISKLVNINSTSFSFEDLRLSSLSSIFPLYVPLNLQSSIDNSNITGLFTIRPVYSVNLLDGNPRALVTMASDDFRPSLTIAPTSIGAIVPSNESQEPLSILATSEGLQSVSFDRDPRVPISESLNTINMTNDIKDLKLFELPPLMQKIVAVKGAMILLIDATSGDVETSTSLSDSGYEAELTTINDQVASVVSVGKEGVDLVFPIIDAEPRVVNFHLSGDTKNIAVIDKFSSKNSPFVVAYDGLDTLSLVDLNEINAQVQTIDTSGEKLTMIAYGGKFTVNGVLTDVLIGVTQRKILLFDLNSLTSIPARKELAIKTGIEDLLVIDGIAYIALGSDGIKAVSIGSLLNSDDKKSPEIAHYKKNKIKVVKSNGKEATISKLINSKILASAKPFLLSSGPSDDLTVIKVQP